MIAKLPLAAVALLSLTDAAAAQQAVTARQEAPIVITRRLPPSPDLIVRTVFIGDLNLTSASGQQEMEKRVGAAIDDMCAIPKPLPSNKGVMEKPCRDEALESARWQMKSATERAARQ
jgi:UrcA family protein